MDAVPKDLRDGSRLVFIPRPGNDTLRVRGTEDGVTDGERRRCSFGREALESPGVIERGNRTDARVLPFAWSRSRPETAV